MQGRGRFAAPTAWAVTWIAYASYYAGRKGFSTSKKSIHEELAVSEAALGAIDTVYLGAYALGQFVSGWLGDRVGARRLVSVGMLLSAAACAVFGSLSGALAFGGLYLFNGLAQSSGWPGTTRAMAEWTTPRNRGTVMAFWATCYQVGGIFAGLLCAELLRTYGWRSTFLVPALWMALVGVLVYVLLRPGPSAAGSEGAARAANEIPSAEAIAERKAAQRAVMKSRELWSFGASYFFIKFIRYTLLFWLPYYLATALSYDKVVAARLANAFDAGGVIGVILIGTLSDRLRGVSRASLSAVALIGLALALLLYTKAAHAGLLWNGLALGLVGAMLFAPDSLLSGAAAQDAGGPHAAAMATGMVNGVGSVGGMLSGIAVPQISKHLGWNALVPTLVLLAIFAAAALLPALIASRKPAAPIA
jgi:sugar phosphate permease